MLRTRGTVLSSALIVCLCCVLAPAVLAKEKKEKPKPVAQYSMAILPPAGADDITPSEIFVEINRFTTPSEKAALLSVLAKKGQSAALTAAQNSPVGILRRAAGLATDILYAMQDSTPDGDRITIVTLRFNVYPNAVMNADPMIEPFTIAFFVPTKDAKGKGKIYGAAALALDKDGKIDISAYPSATADLAFAKIR